MTEDLFGDPVSDTTSGRIVSPAAPAGPTAPAGLATPAASAAATKPARRGKTIQPVAASAELAALAARLPAHLHLGTSTWSYPGWKGLVYDGDYSDSLLSRKGLSAYAAHPLLRAAGVDRGFYAPIPLTDYLAYAAQVPDDFRFLVKAPASVCDPWLRASNGAGRLANAAFLDVEIAVRDFIVPATAGLGAKCGPLLFQLSPLRAMAADAAGFLSRLDAFLSALPALDPAQTPNACYAVELRDPELLTPRFIKLLRTHGVRFGCAARDRMPPLARQAAAQALRDEGEPGPLVLRWLLHEGYGYEQAEAAFEPFDRLHAVDPQTLAAAADLAVRTLQAGQPAYLIVSNNAEGCAPLTLARLAEAIAQRLGV
ncbi:DUF72 domain-containing protein [Cupriavidus sp. H18C1]|uniref:DUF72 domain-containing protein n=1 Tax=Cupriavidus sp. H18C1 TaxID=3241601 RepID=UPI003BB90881